MQLINLITSPVYLSEQCFPYFLITADNSRHEEVNTRHLCLCASVWMSHMYTSMCKWQNVCVFVCVCLHLLPWKETSAAGCQRPPVWLRPAAPDWPACRTDQLSAWAKAAAGRSVRGETAVLLDRPMARHLRQCGSPCLPKWKPGVSNMDVTGNLLCMLEVTDWQGFHACWKAWNWNWNGLKHGRIAKSSLKNTTHLTGRRLILDNYTKHS